MTRQSFAWRQLIWPTRLSPADAIQAIEAAATDPTGTRLVLEARCTAGDVRFILGAHPAQIRRVAALLGATAVTLGDARADVMTARRLVISTTNRSLAVDRLDTSAAAILAALTAAKKPGEELVIQMLLGSRLPATVVPSKVAIQPRLGDVLFGPRQASLDAEARSALACKTSQPGFRSEVRIGVSAVSPARRQSLALGLLGGLRRLEAPGVRLSLAAIPAAHMGRNDQIRWPWRLRSRLNIAEVVGLAALPVADRRIDADLPGLPPAHPRLLAPSKALARPGKNRVVVAQATAPGVTGVLTRSTEALLRHLHVAGPTGTGKSVLLLNVAIQDMAAGRGLIVMEPKGDLIADLLARIPSSRIKDVVLLDPLADQVVGLNPLADQGPGGPSAEVRADQVLAIFTHLFGAALGPRTTDVLHASLLTLARRNDASLVQIPRLLTDPAFRQPRIAALANDVALGPFWSWYTDLRDTERAAVIAPLMNKLRAVLLKPSIRRVLGQVQPKFTIAEVFADAKILLVPLPVASLGNEGAKLLGSLISAQVWDAARARTQVPIAKRRPVSVVLDECQTFLDYQTDIADALATSRGFGVGWTLAHQYLGQLTPALREAVQANCRSRVVLQTSHTDARTFADHTNGSSKLEAEDFTGLPAFHGYFSLYDHGQTQPYTSGRTLPAPPECSEPDQIRAASAERHGRSVAAIEAAFTATGPTKTEPGSDPNRSPRTPPGALGVPDVGAPQPGRLPRRQPGSGAPGASLRSSSRSSSRSGAAAHESAGQSPDPAKARNATPAGSAAEVASTPAEGGQP